MTAAVTGAELDLRTLVGAAVLLAAMYVVEVGAEARVARAGKVLGSS